MEQMTPFWVVEVWILGREVLDLGVGVRKWVEMRVWNGGKVGCGCGFLATYAWEGSGKVMEGRVLSVGGPEWGLNGVFWGWKWSVLGS